jgi:hypothetical protein
VQFSGGDGRCFTGTSCQHLVSFVVSSTFYSANLRKSGEKTWRKKREQKEKRAVLHIRPNRITRRNFAILLAILVVILNDFHPHCVTIGSLKDLDGSSATVPHDRVIRSSSDANKGIEATKMSLTFSRAIKVIMAE